MILSCGGGGGSGGGGGGGAAAAAAAAVGVVNEEAKGQKQEEITYNPGETPVDLNFQVNVGKMKYADQSRAHHFESGCCRGETYPMKVKAIQNTFDASKSTANRLSWQEMKQKRLLAKQCNEIGGKKDTQLANGNCILKGSFHLRQKRKINNEVDGQKNSYCDETWDMMDNKKISFGNSKNNIAPSKIVRSLAEKRSTEAIEWDNPVIGYGKTLEIPSLSSSKSQRKLIKVDLSSQCMFSVEMLEVARIIGPVDNKYIACVVGSKDGEDMIVLIDQHAAHERIRLENLIRRVGYYSNMAFVSGQFTQLVPSLRFPVLEYERDFLFRYKKEFSGVGLNYSLSVGSLSCCVVVHSVPSIFVDGRSWKTKASSSSVNVEFLKKFVLEQGNHMQATGSSCKMSSRMVFKALASYACHGAIKFGDRISFRLCEEIVKDLCKCKLPFQCAHGRPTIAPILRLSSLSGLFKMSRERPNLVKLKKC